MIFNRKGDVGDWTNFAGFFLILILITGGIVGSYFAFFSSEYEFKETEAELLLSRVAGCLSETGNYEIIRGDTSRIYEICDLRNNIEKEHLIYIEDSVTQEEVFFIGVYDYLTQCGLIDENDKFAKCASSSLSLDGGETLRIVAGSNQNSRRIAG